MVHVSWSYPSHLVLPLEVLLVVTGVVFWALAPRVARRVGVVLWTPFRRLGRDPRWLPLWAGLGTVVLVAASHAVLGPPVPTVHDEQSYLLAADTLASGRFANPTPPEWRHFEAIHVLVRPSYASKYPPAPAVPLAVGIVLAGSPALGVVLGAGIFAAVAAWFLGLLLPAPWAAWGATVAGIRLGLGSYWGQSYWGGFVAAVGGMLLWGALVRIHRELRIRDAVLLAVGVAVLATSRPWEGLVASVPAGILFLRWMLVSEEPIRRRALEILVPFGLVLVLGSALLGVYNRAVTGSPSTLPYSVHAERYSPRPLFLWQEAGEPTDLSNPALASFWDRYRPPEDLSDRWASRAVSQLWRRSARVLVFVLGVPLLPPLFCLGRRRAAFWIRWSAATVGCVLLAHALVFSWWPHYSAPVVGLLLFLAVAGLRELTGLRLRDRALGRFPAALALLVFGISAIVQLPAHRPDPSHWSRARQEIRHRLERAPGRDLVLVPLRTGTVGEWVFNRADLREAEIVWARSFGSERDRRVVAAFPERRVWKLVPGTATRSPGIVPWNGDSGR